MSLTYLDSSSIIFIDTNDGGTILAPEGGLLPSPHVVIQGEIVFDDSLLFTIGPNTIIGAFALNDITVVSFATLEVVGIWNFSDVNVFSFGTIEINGIWNFETLYVQGTLEPITELEGGMIQLDSLSIDGQMVVVIALFTGIFITDDIDVDCDIHLVPFDKLQAWLVAAGHNQTLERVSGAINPVVLVYFPEFHRTFGSVNVIFPDLAQTLNIEREISVFSSGGLGPLSIQLDENTDKVQLSGGSLRLLNQEGLSNSFGQTLINKRVEIRIGFTDLDFDDYLLIYTLTVDKYTIEYEHIYLTLIDTILIDSIPLSVPIGQQYFPGAPQNSRSKNIPIIIGVLTDVPTVQVRGDAVGTLAFDLIESDTILYLTEVTALFSDGGQIIIGTNVLSFNGRQEVNIYGKMYLSLLNLIHISGMASHLEREEVKTYNNIYQYVVGYGITTVNQVRDNGVVVPEAEYVVGTLAANQVVTILTFATQRGEITVDVNAANIDQTTVVVNGSFETGDETGWTEVDGALTVSTINPSPRVGNYYGAVRGGLGVYQSVIQDVTVLPDEYYDYGFSFQNTKALSLFVNSGFETGDTSGWIVQSVFNAVVISDVYPGGSAEGARALRVYYARSGSLVRNYSFEDPVVVNVKNLIQNSNFPTAGVIAPWANIYGGSSIVRSFSNVEIYGPSVGVLGGIYQDFAVESGISYRLGLQYSNFTSPSLILDGSFGQAFLYWASNSSNTSARWAITGIQGLVDTFLSSEYVATRVDKSGFHHFYQDIVVIPGQTYYLSFSGGMGHFFSSFASERVIYENASRHHIVEGDFYYGRYTGGQVYYAHSAPYWTATPVAPTGFTSVGYGVINATFMLHSTILSTVPGQIAFQAYAYGHVMGAGNITTVYQGVTYSYFPPGAAYGGTSGTDMHTTWKETMQKNCIVFFSPWNAFPYYRGVPPGTDTVSDIDTAGITTQREGSMSFYQDMNVAVGFDYHFQLLYETMYIYDTVYGIVNTSHVEYLVENTSLGGGYYSGWQRFGHGAQGTYTTIVYATTGATVGIVPQTIDKMLFGLNTYDKSGEVGWSGFQQTPTIGFVATTTKMRVHIRISGTWTYNRPNRAFYYSKARVSSICCYRPLGYDVHVDHYSYVQYAVGVPGNDIAYSNWTVPLSHQNISYDQWRNSGREAIVGFTYVAQIPYVATTTVMRISFYLSGTYSLFPAQTSNDQDRIFASQAVISGIAVVHPGDQYTCQTTVWVGTPENPTAYFNSTLPQIQNAYLTTPQAYGATVFSSSTMMRVTILNNQFSTALTPSVVTNIKMTNSSIIPEWAVLYNYGAQSEVWSLYTGEGTKVLLSRALQSPPFTYLQQLIAWEVIYTQEFATVEGENYAFTFGYITADEFFQSAYVGLGVEVSTTDINYQLGTQGNPSLYVNGWTGQSHLYLRYGNNPRREYPAGPGVMKSPYWDGGQKTFMGCWFGDYPLPVYIPYIRFRAVSNITRIQFYVRCTIKWTNTPANQIQYPNSPPYWRDGPIGGLIDYDHTTLAILDSVYVYPLDVEVPLPVPSYKIISNFSKSIAVVPLVYQADILQDVVVTPNEPYNFSFAYRTGRHIINTVTPYVQGISDVAYQIGIPGNEQSYVMRKKMGQSHQFQNYSPLPDNPPVPFLRTVPEVFTPTSAIVRVRIIMTGKLITADGTAPPYDTQGNPMFVPYETWIDDLQLLRGPGPNQSLGRVLLGTPTKPNQYRTLTLTPQFNWVDGVGIVIPREPTLRITLQSQHTYDPFPMNYDLVYIQSTYSYSHAGGGQNPIDAMLYMMQNFTPNVGIDEESFRTARAALREWKFGTMYTNPGFSHDFFQEMARQCKCLLLKDSEARWTITVLDNSRPIKYFFDQTNILESTSLVRESPPNDVLYTSIYVYFATKTGGSTSTSDFASVVYVTPTDSSDPQDSDLKVMCQLALEFYHREQTLEFFASWIQDYQTARFLLRWLVSRHTTRQESIIFQTWVDAAPIRIGEVAIIDHSVLPDHAPVIAELIDWSFNWDSYTPELKFRVMGLVPPGAPVALDVYIESTLHETVRFSIIQYVTVAPSVTLDLTSVDLDPITSGSQQLVISENEEGQQGTFVADLHGRIQFTPRANDNGEISTQYTYRDSFGTRSNIATITINVLPFIGSAKTIDDGYDRSTATKVIVAKSTDIPERTVATSGGRGVTLNESLELHAELP